MCSPRRKPSCNSRYKNDALVGVLLLFFTLVFVAPANATPDSRPGALDIPAGADAREAWLVTYGPGEIYWQRFGHNAIWLREPARGLDHTFNFGFFDFAQENFLARFARGRMLYFSLAKPAPDEFGMYRLENRSIVAQKLDLDEEQYLRLRAYLLNEVRPANREYLYDYYLNNCSTRVRDALDMAVGGALSAQTKTEPAAQNFRDHTRRLTSMDFWYYLGLEASLGAAVDRDVSRWEEMFIPAVVAETLETFAQDGADGTRPLVSARQVIFSSGFPPPPAIPPVSWLRYLVAGFGLAIAAWLAGRFLSPRVARGTVLAWIALAGTAGLVIAGLWGLTDHHAAGSNVNILLLNPLYWVALAPNGKRVAAVILAAGTGVALMLALLPGWQYNLDVLALAAPLNLSSAVALWRWPAPGNPAADQG